MSWAKESCSHSRQGSCSSLAEPLVRYPWYKPQEPAATEYSCHEKPGPRLVEGLLKDCWKFVLAKMVTECSLGLCSTLL